MERTIRPNDGGQPAAGIAHHAHQALEVIVPDGEAGRVDDQNGRHRAMCTS